MICPSAKKTLKIHSFPKLKFNEIQNENIKPKRIVQENRIAKPRWVTIPVCPSQESITSKNQEKGHMCWLGMLFMMPIWIMNELVNS